MRWQIRVPFVAACCVAVVCAPLSARAAEVGREPKPPAGTAPVGAASVNMVPADDHDLGIEPMPS